MPTSTRANSKGKVLVAMSGGVDSSVAAALLLREGYEVVGCFMRLGSPGETLDELRPYDSAGVSCDPAKVRIGHQGCCSINDAADARLVAAELGIPFYVCNFKKEFGRIIDYFVGEYAAGRTPNPCVRCNDWLKFGKLHEYARQIGADFVATGHYARVAASPSPRFCGERAGVRGGPGHDADRGALGHKSNPVAGAPGSAGHCLLRGIDHAKDQSYVLFGVERARLARMLLPIGHYHKPEIRDTAQRLGLPTFDKPDSQEICFVPDNDYAGLVERRAPALARSGKVLDTAGRVVGEHGGQHRFTIGQRRGVGVALGHQVYVVAKDPATNTVTIGGRDELLSSGCIAGEANWLVDERTLGGMPAALHRLGSGDSNPNHPWIPCAAKIRYNAQPVPARVRIIPDLVCDAAPTPSGRTAAFEVRFDEPQAAVAPGQAVVLYGLDNPDLVLGGGWICRARSASEG